MIRLSGSICQNLPSAILREYIETNGKGGYCSSTIAGLNTRRYHGLLVSALNPPENRHVIVSKVEETIVIKGDKYSLSSNQYKGEVYPNGHKYLQEFRLAPFPKFIYQIGEYRIEKTVFMLHGKNTTVIKYLILPDNGDVELYVRPLLAYRNYHDLQKGDQDMIHSIKCSKNTVKINPNWTVPPLYIYHSADVFREKGFWYNNFEYREEAYRGYDCHEDLYNPGYFIYTFYKPNHYDAWAAFSTEPLIDVNIPDMIQKEISRRSKLVKSISFKENFLESLILTADSFIVEHEGKPNSAIVAGYPWFGQWSRDSLISMPGLCLATGRYNIAKNVLHTLSKKIKAGLLPNFYGSDNEPIYNSADSPLLFFYALYKYLLYTKDYKFAISLIPKLKKIFKSYTEGTLFGIRQNKKGLIEFSEKKMPLTWMDAIGHDSRSNPRAGMVIEINALWYQALKVMEHIMGKTDYLSDAVNYGQMADKVKKQFNKIFWNNETQYFNDFIDGDFTETALRPNQLFAIGMPFPVANKKYWEPVLKIVSEKLLTPYGIRTLAPDHPCYRAHYRGSEGLRQIAYHQGTAWPWLLGLYASALTQSHGYSEETNSYIVSLFMTVKEHMLVGGVGTCSEIFDGDLPYYFRGCISQAWSVAEILRAYNEEILGQGVYTSLFDKLNTKQKK